MLTHAEAARILNQECASANAALQEARQLVDAILTEVPNVLPQPDGLHRATHAIEREKIAAAAYKWALQRSYEFAVSGIVPEDLK
jgi:hypothetical protein